MSNHCADVLLLPTRSVFARYRLLRDVAQILDRHGANSGNLQSFDRQTKLADFRSKQVLHDLRRPEVKFPSSWDSVKLARHTKIVQACLTHDPEVRPSPKDLLASDLLPPRVGDDSIQETIRLLCMSFSSCSGSSADPLPTAAHSGTTHAQSLITALFNQSDEDRLRKDFSYDFYDGEGVRQDSCCRCETKANIFFSLKRPKSITILTYNSSTTSSVISFVRKERSGWIVPF